MLQGCLLALRQQVWPTYAGGSAFTVALRTAKRKHIRIATRKKKTAANRAKAEEVEKPFVPYKIRMLQEAKPKVRSDERLARWLKTPPQDDVWIQRYYLPKICPLLEAVEDYRMMCHPTMLDAPDAPISLEIELNMRTGEKDSKYLEKVYGIVKLPFAPEDKPVMRSVVAICKTSEDQQKAIDAGAEIVGHTNVIQAIERGEIKQDAVDYFVCHVDSVMDTLKLRGLLKRKMPDKKKGTLGSDMAAMVQLFARGADYASTNDFGVTLWANLTFTIGRLDMTNDQITSNVKGFLSSLAPQKNQPEFGPFLNKVRLIAKPSRERLRVDVTPYLPATTVEASAKRKKPSEAKEPVNAETAEESQEEQARVAV